MVEIIEAIGANACPLAFLIAVVGWAIAMICEARLKKKE